MKINYKFYATLLDSFHYYLNSDKEDAFQDFINRLNRVQEPPSEAMLKGIAFNEVLDLPEIIVDDEGFVKHNGFKFRYTLVRDLREYFSGAIKQQYVEAGIQTDKGNVLLYGYIDYLKIKAFDLKTTGKYDFPKFLNAYQHLVYPYCLNKQKVLCTEFVYKITDFNNIYEEPYTFSMKRDSDRIRVICMQLIDFIEEHRELITDEKIFGLI